MQNGPGGIYASSDGGKEWVMVSDTKQSWYSIATDDSGQFVYAATFYEHVYVSTDYGNVFDIIDSLATVEISQWGGIATSSSGQYVYVSTFDNTVYSSGDFGGTFSVSGSISPSSDARFLDTIATSSSGQYVYVAGQASGYIYRSEDYGVTWQSNNSPDAGWSGITSSSSGEIVYASVYSGAASPYKGIYKSMDYGEIFEEVSVDDDNYSFNTITTSSDAGTVYTANGQYVYVLK